LFDRDLLHPDTLDRRKATWNDGPALELHLVPDDAPAVALRSICSGGGGGQQATQQQSTSSSEPPAFIQPYLKGAIGDLWNYYTANPTAPSYYTGETVAPLSTQSQGAVNMASGLAANNPTLDSANSSLRDFLSGKYVDPTTNPDYLKAIDASHQPYIDQFTGTVLPGIVSSFEGSGRTGSGLAQDTIDRATTNLNRTISDADAQAGSTYYTNALNQMLTASGQTPGINVANWQNVAGLGSAGSTVDQQRQAQDTSNQAAYNYDANAQMNYIAQVLGILNGGYPGGVTNSSSIGTQSVPGGSPWGNIFSGVGLALQAAPLLGFSDERLKDIEGRVGETDDGLPLYLYRYKNDPDTPHIGPIAQEVLEERPDAVAMHPSGFLMVDYRAATEPRGLF
jgi:hypothetical protein